ncbi:siderophore-interacting protein [Microbacterium pumilum]|uniref:Siderophore-interacting protein n=1 Tax=Microbacterium pumilum TaxID=344165 RepID=A0ABN2SLV7_9MICO
MTSHSIAVRPAYRPYVTQVSRVERLSPHFVRVVLHGDDLEHFGTAGLDQRIKVLFPHADGSFAEVGQDAGAGDWYDRWRSLPDAARNVFRTYTARRVNPASRTVTVDFVVHHDAGPAGAWAERAVPGDDLVIVGPDERSPQSRIGLDWHPGSSRRLLLAGDETAAPAIAGILESLDRDCDVDAFIEVPAAADAVELDLPETFRVQWLARDDRAHGSSLITALSTWAGASGDLLERAAAPRPQRLDDVDVDVDLLWDSPEAADGEFYAWIAGEAAMVKTIRRSLVSDHGVDRKRVAFMGYWRLGQSERTE